MEPALCEDRDTRSAAGEGESHWDGSQAIMADEPAGFVHNLKSFLLIFYSWVLSLWFKMGNTRAFLYTVFFKKRRKTFVQRGQTYQFYALTLKNWMMFKEGPEMLSAGYFSSGVYWSVWWFLTSFSNDSRRFYLDILFMTFHDLLLVSNETTNLACFTVNTILFVCLPFFGLVFSVWLSYGKRDSSVSVLGWLPSPHPRYTFVL